jgi:hypothetical protein
MENLAGPVLVLCNHQSNFDFMVAAATAYPMRINFMTSTWFFNNGIMAWALKLMGCIPKKQFLPDTAAVKATMRVIARGGNVGIFPEGQVSYAGYHCDIDPSIGRLVKKLGVTTVMLNIRGNYLTRPKWSRVKAYRGQTECTANLLFRPEDLARMTPDAVTRQTLAALAYDDYAWQRQKRVAFKPEPRSAKGLEYVLYRCPSCHTDFTIISAGNELHCTQCGYKMRQNSYGFFEAVEKDLVFDNPADWHRYEKKAVEQELDAGAALPFVTACDLYQTVKGRHGYVACGEGVLTLDRDGLLFEGKKKDEPFRLMTSFDQQFSVAHASDPVCIDVPGEQQQSYGLAPQEYRHTLKMIEMFHLLATRRRAQKEGRA